MKELAEAIITIPDHLNCGNGQQLKETLMRLAVRYCDFNATDILVFFDFLLKRMEEEEFMFKVGFRKSGVDWNPETVGSKVHHRYRYFAWVSKKRSVVKIIGEHGNV